MIQAKDLIRKKRDGGRLSAEDIRFLVDGAATGDIPDYQTAAWLMAGFLQGLDEQETDDLARAMLESGAMLNLAALPGPAVDKHSTGGVGDKTSLVVAPLAAANGLYVPMIAGRGLGHTGGTLDKLASIKGFRTDLVMDRFLEVLQEAGACITGQTAEIAPADRVLYQLRDATATVESKPFIAASIMSKKLAEGISGLVLDVKAGAGAFTTDPCEARELAAAMARIGRSFGVRVTAVVTDMDEPLGWAVGNALEVAECVEILRGEVAPCSARLVRLCVELAARMLLVGKVEQDLGVAKARCERSLQNGSALEAFRRMVRLQGGDDAFLDDLSRLPQATIQKEVRAPSDGWIASCDAMLAGRACCLLGAGRECVSSPIDPSVGVALRKKRGEAVVRGEAWADIHGNEPERVDQAADLLEQALAVSADEPRPRELILAEERG